MAAANVVLLVWGFLVGFVGWGSVLRLIEPVSSWLCPMRSTAPAAAALSVRLVVMLFLVAAAMSALAVGPLIMIVGASPAKLNDDWRSLMGLSFVGSLGGWAAFGILQRIFSRDEGPDD
jgi:hypothetical protein